MNGLFFANSDDPATTQLTRPVTVLEKGVYRGPHYYSRTPMVRIMLDLGRMEEWPSNRIPGFAERLAETLPGLGHHGCSFKRRGGFLRRLEEGTWFGHIAEHVALELQTLAGSRTKLGKTRSVKGRPGVYNVMYAYHDEQVGLMAGRIALELIDSLLPDSLSGVEGLDRIHAMDGPFDFRRRMADLARLVRRTSYGPTTQALVNAARRRGIPVARLSEGSLIQLGQGRYQQRLRASISGRTPLIAVEAAGNKDFTKKILGDNGIPVPRGVVVRNVEEALREAKRLRYPLVTKPLDGNHGRGVTIGIANEEQLRFGFEEAAKHGSRIVVEQFFAGRDHRILVIDGRVVAAAERVPAHVVGDGRRSIAELIQEVNRDPRRGEGHEKVMTRIKVDAHVTEYLGRQDLEVSDVPEPGQVVMLRATANLSTGGTAIDRTNEMHPDNVEIARRAAMLIGLDIAGIDFISPDIRRSVRETGGGVIEVNAAPGFRMHLEPSEGTPRDVAGPVIDMLFPPGAPSRVPVLAITGTNGKSTTARMVKHVLRYTGKTVGLTSTSGVYVNDVLISEGDATGPRSARMVLRDPCVEVAVLETARGGLLREGLAFDYADVGAVLNVGADHIGLKGIDSVEDLAKVKSLIVETVRSEGTSVLNADDPLTRRMTPHARGRIAWFSLAGGEDMAGWLRAHVTKGGLAVLREPGPEGGTIVLHEGGRRETVMDARDIPATLHGLAEFNIANALAAIAIAAAQGVEIATIRGAFLSFQSSFEQNPGRLNVHDEHGFRVILDYAHNPAALEAMGALLGGLRARYPRMLGCLSIPGDRRDEDIVEMGRLAAGMFDRIYFREDPSTRGRTRGEIMTLMQQGALQAGASPEEIRLIAGEAEAAQACLADARPGDLVVITPTSVEAAWRQVVDFRPPAREAALVAKMEAAQ